MPLDPQPTNVTPFSKWWRQWLDSVVEELDWFVERQSEIDAVLSAAEEDDGSENIESIRVGKITSVTGTSFPRSYNFLFMERDTQVAYVDGTEGGVAINLTELATGFGTDVGPHGVALQYGDPPASFTVLGIPVNELVLIFTENDDNGVPAYSFQAANALVPQPCGP